MKSRIISFSSETKGGFSMYMEILKDHHDSIGKLIASIDRMDTAEKVERGASDLSSAISRLAGLISVHLAAEDKFLYPNLSKSSNEKLREMSKTFEKEMGGLAKAFMAYKEDWMTPTKIKDNPAACLAATQATIGALKKRLAREDKEL